MKKAPEGIWRSIWGFLRSGAKTVDLRKTIHRKPDCTRIFDTWLWIYLAAMITICIEASIHEKYSDDKDLTLIASEDRPRLLRISENPESRDTHAKRRGVKMTPLAVGYVEKI